MDQYSLQLPTKSLTVNIYQKVNEDRIIGILADSQELINNLITGLDYTNPRSEINFIQETLPPVKLELSKLIADFIKTNLEIAVLTEDRFTTIPSESGWKIDKTFLIKPINAVFQSHALITPYIIDKLALSLKNNHVSEFLIQTDNYIQSGGEHGVEIENPIDGSSIQALIADNALCMYVPKKPPVVNSDRSLANPFSKQSSFGRNALIVTHKDIVMAKAISEIASNLAYAYELQKLCNQFNCQIIDIDAVGQIHHYQ